MATFIFVQEESDFLIAPILTAFGFIISGIWSLFLIRKEFGIKFVWQKIEILRGYIIDGWHIFISSFGINLYKNNAIFILGIFTDDVIVGYFAIAKKVIDALNQIASIISGVIFPYVSNKFKLSIQLFKLFYIQ